MEKTENKMETMGIPKLILKISIPMMLSLLINSLYGVVDSIFVSRISEEFVTPIYYYEMSGQMKTMLDRANPLYFVEHKFRDVYLLASAADEDEHAVESAVKGLSGWISCFPKAALAGTVFAGGVDKIVEIEGHPALEKAYQAGREA